MAAYTWTVKKQFSASGDIAGYKSTRYEKIEASYGFIPNGSYKVSDVITFPSVPQKDLVKAVFHTAGGTVVTVYPSTSLANAIAITGAGGAPIDYQFEYVRNGNGNNSVTGTPAISIVINS